MKKQVEIYQITRYLTAKALWEFIDKEGIGHPRVLVKIISKGHNRKHKRLFALVQVVESNQVIAGRQSRHIESSKLYEPVRPYGYKCLSVPNPNGASHGAKTGDTERRDMNS